MYFKNKLNNKMFLITSEQHQKDLLKDANFEVVKNEVAMKKIERKIEVENTEKKVEETKKKAGRPPKKVD